MTPLEERAVLPFYLKMMGLNATSADSPTNGGLWTSLVRAGRTTDTFDVKWLLNVGAWRPVVMGAWFSLRFSATQVGIELRRAMQHSAGSLTAPPLATACLLVTGTDSLPELTDYVQTALADGSEKFVSAAIESLGATAPLAITDSHRTSLRAMIDCGVRLRHDLTYDG